RDAPGRRLPGLDLLFLQPLLHVPVEQVAAVAEPALPLDRVVEEHVLEAPERALAVDGDHQPLAQRLVGPAGDEALHPPFRLAAAGRLTPREGLPPRLHLGPLLGVVDRALLHGHDVPGPQIEEALRLRRVALESSLEIGPVDGYDAHRKATPL